MANSPSHRFGQIIGELIEEIITPQLQRFCDDRGLYIDKRGIRGDARDGRRVSWIDRYGNSHDLDFVIERGGCGSNRGRPLAFIEAAWRRYAKHSRNKAQEIQGAILPIAEQHEWDKPFLGVVLAGVFTEGSVTQMRSSGFEVVLFPYQTIVDAFRAGKISVAFDEDTPDSVFKATVDRIGALTARQRTALKSRLIKSNQLRLDQFFRELRATLDRQIASIILIPLHGRQSEFDSVNDAISFVSDYCESTAEPSDFRKYEIVVRYNNDDRIEAAFQEKAKAVAFLRYIEAGVEQ